MAKAHDITGKKKSIFLLLKMNSLKIETIKAAAASERR